MSAPFNAGLVPGQDWAAMRALLEDWLARPGLRRLVEMSGGTWSAEGSLADRLRRLYDFSTVWDARAGRERHQVGVELADSERGQFIIAAATELGLIVPALPSQAHYDYGVVLGGTATSCLLRTRCLARLARSQPATAFGQIVLLGADRPVAPIERAVGDTYAPQAQTEYELLQAAAQLELHDLPHIVVNVPSGNDTGRTNTGDEYRYLVDTYGLTSQHKVLISTSQIYYPYHLFGALIELGWPSGVQVEIVGYPAEWVESQSRQRSTPHILQEVRSGLHRASELAIMLDA